MQVLTFFIKSAREGFPSFHVSPNRKSTSEISLGVQTFLAFLNSNERPMAFASFSLKGNLEFLDLTSGQVLSCLDNIERSWGERHQMTSEPHIHCAHKSLKERSVRLVQFLFN